MQIKKNRQHLSNIPKNYTNKIENIQIQNEILNDNIILYTQLKEQEKQISKLLSENLIYKETNKILYDKINILTTKAQEYNDIIKNLKHIKLKAESEALNLLENAQCNAMDAIYIIDDIEKEVKLFQKDIQILKKDIDIGTATIQDRILSFYHSISSHMKNLNKIKKLFFAKNDLPEDLNYYHYINNDYLKNQKDYYNQIKL